MARQSFPHSRQPLGSSATRLSPGADGSRATVKYRVITGALGSRGLLGALEASPAARRAQAALGPSSQRSVHAVLQHTRMQHTEGFAAARGRPCLLSPCALGSTERDLLAIPAPLPSEYPRSWQQQQDMGIGTKTLCKGSSS